MEFKHHPMLALAPVNVACRGTKSGTMRRRLNPWAKDLGYINILDGASAVLEKVKSSSVSENDLELK